MGTPLVVLARDSEDPELSSISATFVLEGIRAIAENVDARHADRLRAYELLGKHLRLFSDRIEQDTHITVTIERIGG